MKIVKVYAMRSKVYFVKCRAIKDGKITKINRMKGTPKIVSEGITEDQFHDALLQSKTQFVNFNKIKANNHKIQTVCIRRRAMTGFDGMYH